MKDTRASTAKIFIVTLMNILNILIKVLVLVSLGTHATGRHK